MADETMTTDEQTTEATDERELESQTAEGEVADDGDDPDTVDALKKELARVRSQGRGQETQALLERIANLEGRLASTKQEEAPKTYTAEQLEDFEVGWLEHLTEAKASGDEKAIREAREGLKRVRAEQRKVQLQSYEQERTKNTVDQQANALMDTVSSLAPDLSDKSSPLYQAALKQYKQFEGVLGQAGKLGDALAVALAVLQDPNLVGKKITQKITNNLEAATKAAMRRTGGGGRAGSGPTKVEDLSPEEFAKVKERIKKGEKAAAILGG